MTQKTVFDTTKNMQYLSADGFFGQGIEICASSAYDAVYSIAIKYAKKKQVHLVCREKDFQTACVPVTKALRDAKMEFSTLLVEDSDFDIEKAKSTFNFSSGVVLAVGDESVLSLALFYASKYSVDCHALLTEPHFENAFSKQVKIPSKNIPLTVKVKPFKTVIYDFDIIKKASNNAFATAYASVISNLLAMVDYKMRIMLIGGEGDELSFNTLKKIVYMVANLASYKNAKDVLIYAEAVASLVRAKNEDFTSFAVELFADTLNLSSAPLSKGDKIMSAFLKLAPLYKMFFSNDFSSLLSMPNYLGDAYELEKLSGQFAGNFTKNVKVPSKKRLELMLEMLAKTAPAFNAEVSQILKIATSAKLVYQNLTENKAFTFPPYSDLKQALKLSTYLTNKPSVLSVFRDLGVINTVNL